MISRFTVAMSHSNRLFGIKLSRCHLLGCSSAFACAISVWSKFVSILTIRRAYFTVVLVHYGLFSFSFQNFYVSVTSWYSSPVSPPWTNAGGWSLLVTHSFSYEAFWRHRCIPLYHWWNPAASACLTRVDKWISTFFAGAVHIRFVLHLLGK